MSLRLQVASLQGVCRHSCTTCPTTRVNRTGRKRPRRSDTVASALEEKDAEELMQQDLERWRTRSAETRSQTEERVDSELAAESTGAKELLDKVLIADFFVVCSALAWLGAGVIEKGTVRSTRLLDAWFPLWQVVFQPAIGVLMLGALASGGLGWLRGRKS